MTAEDTGEVLDVPESVPGPTNDLKLLEQSGALDDVPPEVGAAGDLAYVGAGKTHPRGPVATPRRKPAASPGRPRTWPTTRRSPGGGSGSSTPSGSCGGTKA